MHRSRLLRALGNRPADKPPPISARNPMGSAYRPNPPNDERFVEGEDFVGTHEGSARHDFGPCVPRLPCLPTKRVWQRLAGMAKTCPCLPMGATPNPLAHMRSLAHMGRAKRLQRVLAPFGRMQNRSWRSSRWTCGRPSLGCTRPASSCAPAAIGSPWRPGHP